MALVNTGLGKGAPLPVMSSLSLGDPGDWSLL